MKLILAIMTLVLFSISAIAQNSVDVSSKAPKSVDFGLMGGLNLSFFNVTEGQFGTYQDVQVNFYGGVFVDFNIVNHFHFQPELLYIGLGDFRFLNVPLYLKYNIYTNFDFMVGPSINYFFDFFSKKIKIHVDLSLAYNISSSLNIHMKYTIGFQQISPSGLFLGVGYKI